MRRLLVLAAVSAVVGIALVAARGSTPAVASVICDKPAGFNQGGIWPFPSFPLGTERLVNGTVITVIAGQPSAGSPTLVSLRVTSQPARGLPFTTHTTTVPFPGTATYTVLAGRYGASVNFQWSLDTGSATWMVCIREP
jgi:hypothetical protein